MSEFSAGIDFGTSNSGVAVYDGSKVQLLPIDEININPEVVKTVIYITRNYDHYIGQEAINTYFRDNVDRPRRFVKKWIGETDFIASEMHYVRDLYMEIDELNPGRLIQYIKTGLRSDGYSGTIIFDRFFTLKKIISLYLREIKTRAEKHLDQKLNKVVLGRPVVFFENPEMDKQSENTLEEAARDAGFNEISFEKEPIAAALYYETSIDKTENALIFDFGGGTLDITIMQLGNPAKRRIYATGGIGIAGSDFDQVILQNNVLEHFGLGEFPEDPRIGELINSLSDWQVIPELSTPQNRTLLQRTARDCHVPTRIKALETIIFNDLAFSLYNKVEAAKINLSSKGCSLIQMNDKFINIWELITRSQFEQDIMQLANKIENCLLSVIEESGLEPEQIDRVIKTGGSSSIPLFTRILEKYFPSEKISSSNTFSSVTAGLAIKAYEDFG